MLSELGNDLTETFQNNVIHGEIDDHLKTLNLNEVSEKRAKIEYYGYYRDMNVLNSMQLDKCHCLEAKEDVEANQLKRLNILEKRISIEEPLFLEMKEAEVQSYKVWQEVKTVRMKLEKEYKIQVKEKMEEHGVKFRKSEAQAKAQGKLMRDTSELNELLLEFNDLKCMLGSKSDDVNALKVTEAKKLSAWVHNQKLMVMREKNLKAVEAYMRALVKEMSEN